jgi:hypothetical protein
MPEGNKVPTIVSKLDELLDEYAEKRRSSELQGDIYVEFRDERQGSEINCRFKDSCFAYKSNTGNCPCGLNE